MRPISAGTGTALTALLTSLVLVGFKQIDPASVPDWLGYATAAIAYGLIGFLAFIWLRRRVRRQRQR